MYCTADYAGLCIYQNDTLQYIGMEEGRVRPKTPNRSDTMLYDYFEKDHLGNIRTVLTVERQQDVYPAATLEAFAGVASVEDSFYAVNLADTISTSSLPWWNSANNYPDNNGNPPYNNNPYLNTTDTSKIVYRLNGATGDRAGLGVTLKVMTGDVVDVYANAFWHYNGTNPSNGYTVASTLNSFISAFAGTPAVAGSVSKGAAAALENTASATPGEITTWLGGRDSLYYAAAGLGKPKVSYTVPQAFVNWILFDDQFNIVSSSSGYQRAVTTPDVINSLHNTVTVSKSGFLYVYCSNESNVDVFFDNLQVIQTRGPLLETDNYYPFGLTMSGISSQAAGKLENKLKYNGKEIQHKEFSDGSGLEWTDYGARMYDQQIGRWDKTDGKAELYFATSPYVFALNQPTNAIDPDGNLVLFINGNHVGNGGTREYWWMWQTKTYSVLNANGRGSHLVTGPIMYQFDRKMEDMLGDHNDFFDAIGSPFNPYKDGGLGGFMIMGLDPEDRFDAGHHEGEKDAKYIIDNLGRDKNHNISESIKVVAHSMGGMYAKGYIMALLEYAKKNPGECIGLTITEYDIAIYQPDYQGQLPGVKTYQFANDGDGVNKWYLASSNHKEAGDVDYQHRQGGAHSIITFDWILQYLSNSQNSNNTQSSDPQKPPKHRKLGG